MIVSSACMISNERFPKVLWFLSFIWVIMFGCFKEKRSDKAAERMQEFVVNISDYARIIDPDFIVIPQNGVELAFNGIDSNEGLNTTYMSSIDGLGVEELFYNGEYTPDQERLEMLDKLGDEKTILVAEYLANDANVSHALNENAAHDFLCFPRTNNNYHYQYIPEIVPNENANEIHALSEAQNYLYLISTDQFTSKEEMIEAVANTNYDLVILDLFFEESPLTCADLATLKVKANGAKRLVIAYMNIGSAENYRYYWKKGWGLRRPGWLKRKYDGYSDEYWVEFWNYQWQEIIYGNDDSYTKKVLDAGFDGVYLDNVEAYYFLYFRD